MAGIRSLKKSADKAMSKYIRLRDALRTMNTRTHAKCITCDKVQEIKKMDAGHWMSRGSGATRYDERNVWTQCKGCNRFSTANVSETFRRALKKMDPQIPEVIYPLSKQTKRFTEEELVGIRKNYQEKYEKLWEDSEFL